MAIRIEKIKINRVGPLESSFELSPGRLNLIYGHNETGKTFIVESMVRFLFKTGSKAPAEWSLRDWDYSGRILVSGLADSAVSFTKTGEKLDDYWNDSQGLPRDFSRLLVVKAGESRLVPGEDDGIGRDFLRTYLSGEGLLDQIQKNISRTLQETVVENRTIRGKQQGEIKKRAELEQKLAALDSLLAAVDENFNSGEIQVLKQELSAIDDEIREMDQAKRYLASRLDERISHLEDDLGNLPDEESVAEIELDIRELKSKESELAVKREEAEALEQTSNDYEWTKNALASYKVNVAKGYVHKPIQVLGLMGVLFFIGSVLSSLYIGWGRPIIPILLALCALASISIFFFQVRKALLDAGKNQELERLSEEFQRKFGNELPSEAYLQTQIDRLASAHTRSKTLSEDVERISIATRTLEKAISESFTALTGEESLPREDWTNCIRRVKAAGSETVDEISETRSRLDRLALRKEEYVHDQPEIEWNSDHHGELVQERDEIQQALNTATQDLDGLKTRIAQETKSRRSDWNHLIEDLRLMQEHACTEYNSITAEILAKVQVGAAISEFRSEEDARIRDGLSRDEIAESLPVLAPRYQRILQDEDGKLMLASEDGAGYLLTEISTGAQEQIMLGLRIGFASIAMGEQTAFLILDDAFQHSDWERRRDMINYTVELTRRGWQIFYFTMDDNIRDLFMRAGDELGDAFVSVELK